jgi:hypothetical protein
MLISLKEKLNDQRKIEAKLEPINSEITDYINQKEIFDIIKSSMKYGFEIKNESTNAYVISLTLLKQMDETYVLFIGENTGYISSDVKPLSIGFITLNEYNKLEYEAYTINKNKISIEEIKNVIKFTVGV